MDIRKSVLPACAAIALASPMAWAQQAPAASDAGSAAAAAPAASDAPPLGQPAWELVVAPFAYHWSNEDKHTHVYLLGIEREMPDGFMWGFSAFQNSFGQASAYAYYGYTWNDLFPDHPNWYVKLSGGVIYGYVGEYKNKVPFNHDGFGLGIIPAIGYRITPRDAVQVGVLGSAALIFTYNRRF